MFGFLDFEEGVAVRHQDGTLSYREFKLLLSYLAGFLEKSGTSPGERVATFLPNSLELLASYYGCLLNGLVVVPINERLSLPEVRKILNHCQPRILLTSQALTDRHPSLFQLEAVQTLVLQNIRGWIDEPPSWAAEGVPRPFHPAWSPEHPAIIFYTSGSTGAPKGVLYTHRTLLGNSRVFGNGFEITRSDHSVLCHCMSSNFVFAQLTVPFLDVGATVEVVDFGSVDQTLTAIEEGATFLSLIPWFGFQLIETGLKKPRVPNLLRIVEVGGDRVPLGFFADFKEAFGLIPREHLGMAEANTFTSNPLLDGDLRLGSVGRPLPEVELQVRGLDRGALPAGAEGEIWVRTPGAMEAYWQDPVATREVMVDGWVATGDAGYLDSDGFLWLSGRIKHIIICDGDNIHPGEVEREIAKHPRVKRVSVFGIRHETRGETVAAAVILRKGEDEFTLSDLQGFLDDRLSEVKVPKSLLILDRFPETVGDKLDREAMAGALRERLMSSGDGLRGEE